MQLTEPLTQIFLNGWNPETTHARVKWCEQHIGVYGRGWSYSYDQHGASSTWYFTDSQQATAFALSFA